MTDESSRLLAQFAEIAIRLSTERDLTTLLDLILSQARRVTQSDAGSLYLVDPLGGAAESVPRLLRFTRAQNDSRPAAAWEELTLAIDAASVAGWVALTREPLVLEDAYRSPAGAPYRINRSFDERLGYRTRSLLTVPMQTAAGDLVGVLQLINAKRDPAVRLETPADVTREVVPYRHGDVALVRALASQAAVAVDNSLLHTAIERLFEGFVLAAVNAIEQRDPATFGHSERVAQLTTGLAVAVERTETGPYGEVRFSPEQLRELRYAGLLHDFGKVGVREEILGKARKLPEPALARIRERYRFLVRTAEWEYQRARADYLERHGREGYDEFQAALSAHHAERRRRLDQFLAAVEAANLPTDLREEQLGELAEFARETVPDVDGRPVPLLLPDDFRFLSIRKGNLDEQERREIESHVTQSFRFLQTIPWTRELAGIPGIAYAHHERLDGSGYPQRLTGERIPLQTRMMTIADIYDALTASDRPYKPPLRPEEALQILRDEVNQGGVDGELFRVFVEQKVFESAQRPD